LSTLDFYPYTGHHIQAHFHQVGPDVRDTQNLNVQSGDHGFFIDFPIDHPPSKTAKEYRLILIGGSAAQGFGARANDDMFYRRLGVKVNALLASRQNDARLHVINLAVASAISYQNFLALNMWGHPLEPDAILSFAGVNELSTYRIFKSNLFNHAASYGGLSLSQRHWESQGWQQLLANFFPAFSNTRTSLKPFGCLLCRSELGNSSAAMPPDFLPRILGLPRPGSKAMASCRSYATLPTFPFCMLLNRSGTPTSHTTRHRRL
jgi:hypothetical protein